MAYATVVSINLRAGVVLFSDDERAPLDSMFDGDGDDTDDASIATAVVAQHPRNGRWYAIDVGSFERTTVQ